MKLPICETNATFSEKINFPSVDCRTGDIARVGFQKRAIAKLEYVHVGDDAALVVEQNA